MTLARATALCLALAGAIGCGSRGGGPTVRSGDLLGARSAVVVSPASLHAQPGDDSFGRLAPDVVVDLLAQDEGWLRVRAAGRLPVEGWVRASHVGCRALRDTDLERGGADQPRARVRAGALLAVVGRSGDDIEVRTSDPVSVLGRLPADDCGVGESFAPLLPHDGELHVTAREAVLVVDEVGGGEFARLPAGYRFVVLERRGRTAIGRTDGPVVVAGHLSADALVENPRTTPLDRLAEPLGYTHEVIVDEPLLAAPDGARIALLPGGTPLNVVATRPGWARVRSHGPVQLDGWVGAEAVRRVALDHNEIPPEALRRRHTPEDRGTLREAEPAPQAAPGGTPGPT